MRNTNHKKDSKRYYDWLYHAYLDLLTARLLYQHDSEKNLHEPIVFHCQQAIEKSCKAFMLYKAARLFDGHNITWLLKQTAMLDENFKPFIEKTAELNKFYIETRYPADIPTIISGEFVLKILNICEDIIDIACDAVKFDFNSYHKRRIRS